MKRRWRWRRKRKGGEEEQERDNNRSSLGASDVHQRRKPVLRIRFGRKHNVLETSQCKIGMRSLITGLHPNKCGGKAFTVWASQCIYTKGLTKQCQLILITSKYLSLTENIRPHYWTCSSANFYLLYFAGTHYTYPLSIGEIPECIKGLV